MMRVRCKLVARAGVGQTRVPLRALLYLFGNRRCAEQRCVPRRTHTLTHTRTRGPKALSLSLRMRPFLCLSLWLVCLGLSPVLLLPTSAVQVEVALAHVRGDFSNPNIEGTWLFTRGQCRTERERERDRCAGSEGRNGKGGEKRNSNAKQSSRSSRVRAMQQAATPWGGSHSL